MALLKKIGKAVGKVVKVAAPIVGAATGNPLLGKAIGAAAGGLLGARGAKKASKAMVEEQRNALMQAQGYQTPYANAGTAALDELTALNSGDYSGFENSPDFLAALKFGGQAVERSAAARGGLNSGNTLTDLTRFGQGTAASYLGNYRNALFQTAGSGQRAAEVMGANTLNAGQAIGDARASGIVGKTNALTGAVDQIGAAVGDYVGSKKPKIKVNKNSLYGMNLRQRQPAAGSVA